MMNNITRVTAEAAAEKADSQFAGNPLMARMTTKMMTTIIATSDALEREVRSPIQCKIRLTPRWDEGVFTFFLSPTA
jgi:hypothetical protein